MKKIIFIFILLLHKSCSSTSQYQMSDHYDGNEFHNIKPVDSPSFLFVANHILFGRSKDWVYNDLASDDQAIKNKSNRKINSLRDEKLAIHWVGHASMLIQIGGKNILTDPVWSYVVGPFSFFGPTRAQKPGIEFQDLPSIDYVLLSHDHFDHTDIPTLKRLKKSFNPKFLVPLGMKELLEANEISNTFELDWWDEIKINENMKVYLTPAQHNAGRSLFDRNKRLWGSFVLEYKGYRVFFGGDTAYSDHFKKIKERIGKIHISILPIGAYEPREEMKKFHISPEEAVQAYLDMGSDYFIPIHFSTFNLAAESQKQPLEDLYKAMEKKGISKNSILFQSIGGKWEGNLNILK